MTRILAKVRQVALSLPALLVLSLAGLAHAQTNQQSAEILRGTEAAEELYDQGKTQEAMQRALAVRRLISAAAGTNSPYHVPILNLIGDIYVLTNREAEAEKSYREALAIAERVHGRSDRHVVPPLRKLGHLYRDVERYDEGEAIFKRALAILEKVRGKNHEDVADLVVGLALIYQETERHREAEQFYQRALAIQETAFGENSETVADTLGGLGVAKQKLGKYGDAEALYKRSLAIRERVLGPESEDTATSLSNLADFYRLLGRLQESEALARRALVIREKVLGPQHVQVGRSLSVLGSVLAASGRYAEAEPLYRRSLQVREAALGPEHSTVSLTVNNLANVYSELGRLDEAESLYRRSLAIREKTLPPDSPQVAEALGNLGATYRRMGKLDLAEPLQKRALAIREKILGADHPAVGTSLNNLAVLLGALDRHEEASVLFRRALVIREKSLGPDHPDTAVSLGNVAIEEQRLGRTDEAEKLYRRALAIREKALGPRHPAVAETLNSIAWLHLGAERLQDALSASRRAVRIVIDRLVASSGNGLDLDLATFERVLNNNLDLLQRAGAEGQTTAPEAFEIMQRANQSSTAAALNQMAARFAAGNDRMAGLVRQQQDTSTELLDLNKTLLAEISKPSKERKLQAEQALRARIVKAEESLARLSERLKKEFPRYAELVNPKPLALKQVQQLLGPDEALLVYHLGAGVQFVFAITRDGVEWQALTLNTDDIAEKVQILRDQLDPDAAGQGGAAFDLRTAHDLYVGVMSPIEAAIASKPHLLIVAAGPLTSVPFQVLVTQPPTRATGRPSGDYLDVAWLSLRHSLTVLPSVGSIQVLREVAVRNSAPQPYIGFGDPVFRPGGDGTKRKAAKSAAKRTIPYREAFRGSRADTDSLSRALAPLPDTADELRAFAKTLKVSEAALKLGSDASETTVKSLRLSDYRIVHFATHALVAGEVALFSEQAEPALALTIPEMATSEDDGLLTSSEVAGLNLNADWVILSACNTAAGDKPGAEALTGLARAFFYAGARTLLVSHWPVQSAAAVRLTTRTIALLDEKPNLPPAEALRVAMLDLMKDKSEKLNAHPAVWAPFVVVGTARR